MSDLLDKILISNVKCWRAQFSSLQIHNFVAGVPKLDLPRLDPLLIKNYSMGVHKIPINLDFSLQNAQILGPGNISITTVK